MAPSTDSSPPKQKQTAVSLRLNPATGIDQYGELIAACEVKEFTEAEAGELLSLLDPHGARIFKRAKG
jgi:hypothetical protein